MEGKVNINTFDFDDTVKMIKVAYSLDLLEHIHEYTDSLLERVKHILNMDEKKTGVCYTYLGRPLIYYYGYSLLMKGTAYKKTKKFTEAKSVINSYSDLSWFPGLDEKTLSYVEKFAFFAKANNLELELLSGNANAVDAYVSFLKDHPSEILNGLTSILEAAITYDFDVDHVLAEMPCDPISHFKEHNNPDSIDRTYFRSYLNQLVTYYIKKNEHTLAVNHTLELLRLLDDCGNVKWYKNAVGLFELLKENASTSQLNEYREIILKGVVSNEEISDRDIFRFVNL